MAEARPNGERRPANDPPAPSFADEVTGIVEKLEKAGFAAWAVGGALRDLLLGLEHPDVDIATAATPDQVLQLFKRTVPVGVAHGTVGVLGRSGKLYEVTTFRRDVRTDGRHAEVEFGVSLADDLARRDFTINALAYHPLHKEWQDPFNGRADLKAGILRAVGDPAARFREDYLRILRAIRFAARFEFTIDPPTWAAAVEAAPGLSGLSAERVRDEWFKGLRTARSVPGLIRLWREVGAAKVWLPELETVWQYPNPEVRDPVVLTSVVVRNPAEVLLRLRASNDEINRARAIARNPAAPGSEGAVGARRWLATVTGAADDLLLAARYREGTAPSWAREVAGVRTRGEATARGALAVTGDDLMALGLAAGPALGALLDRLLEAVIIDPRLNDREKLLELAKQ